MKTSNKILGSLPLAAAMAFLGAGSAQALDTTITGTTGGNDSWNTVANWTAGVGVPTGTTNAIIAANLTAKVENAVVPTYTGSLTMGTNSFLQVGYTTNNAQNINVLGTVGFTTIYMNAGSVLNLRTAQPASYSIPAIQLLGNATIRMGESTQGGSGRTFAGGISGPYKLTLQSNDNGDKVAYLTVANTFGELVADGFWGTGWDIRANAAGSLGGNVTIKAYPATNVISANLIINAADAMADTATLTLNGPASATKLTMNQSDTIGALVVDGVRQPAGKYGKTGSVGTDYQVSWLTGNGILTVLPAPAQYWDLNDTAAGACVSGDTAPATWDAANTYWNATADGTTTSPAFWTAGQTAVFAAGTDATGTYIVSVSGTQDIGGLAFEEGNVSLSGDGLRMTADSLVTVASGSTATIGSAISNDTARQLTKSGAGKLVLSATNTYTGTTRIEGGTLSVASLIDAATDSPLGNYPTAGAGGLVLAGGTLQYTGGTTSINRGLTLVGNSTIDVTTAGTALTLGACATDATYALNVTGDAGSSLALGTVTVVDGAGMTFNPTTASLTVASFAANWVYGSGNGTITLGGTATGNSIPGAIAITTGGGNLSVVKNNSSTWTLSGASSYGGTTTVNVGNLIAGTNAPSNANGAFGKATSDVSLGVAGGNSAAGILIGGAFTVGRPIRFATNNATDAGTRVITLGGNTADNSVFSAAIYLGTASQTSRGVTLTAANGGQVTFSGVIQDPTGQDATEAAAALVLTAVTKVGLGTVVLSAANAYTGATLVSEGTLSLGNGTANSNLYDLSTVSVATGAVLNLNYTGSDSISFLNLDGSPAAAGKWGRINSIAELGADYESALITGNGLLNNTNGTGSLYLWDGGIANIPTNGDGVSAGGNGEWDTAIQNWDRGITTHAAWGNTTADRAVFGAGTANYTVTITTPITLGSLTFEDSNFSHTISGGTLNFGVGGSITNKNDTSSKTQKITSAITGSPSVALAAGSPSGGAEQYLEFAPTSGTVALGTVNLAYNDGDGGDKSHLRLAGSTTGNTIASVIQGFAYGGIREVSGEWTLGAMTAGRIWLDGGTMIINGTFSSAYQGFAQAIPSGARLGGNLTYSMSTSQYGQFIVNSGGIVAPGNPAVDNGVGTVTVEYATGNAAVGQTTFNNGSIYEWQVGPANVTDKVYAKRTSTATNNNRTLTVGAMILKIKDAGGTPLATDELPVFTYDTGVVRTLSLGAVVFNTDDLVGKGWTIGTLALTDNGSGTIYLTGLSKGGSPFATWAGAGVAFDADANNDGVDNGMAWVLGALDKDANAIALLPTLDNTTDPDFFIFTYRRDDDANTDPKTTIKVEYGSDLAGWTPAVAGADIIITPTDDGAGVGIDLVQVKIRRTLAVDGKLFARLNVENTP